VRFLIHWLLRREDLCGGPKLCPSALDDATRCADCPVVRLEEALDSESGWLLQRALDLDFALRTGLTLTPNDVALDEFVALRILFEERDRHAAELSRRCPPRTPFNS
jgi:hypothetical protein